MAQEKQLNDLLRWSITNSSTDPAPAQPAQPRDPAEFEALRKALFSGPSEAQLMVQEMTAVKSAERALEDRVTAFDNFHMLLESLDNANNLANLKLWDPLLAELENEEEELRMMAAWCVSTAVQNNERTQKELAGTEALPKLTNMAISDSAPAVRKKAILSLSSAVRNCPEALSKVLPHLPASVKPVDKTVEANDMETINELIANLRASIQSS